ncbi:unnamed protein product, partial [marine sediment metagenome]
MGQGQADNGCYKGAGVDLSLAAQIEYKELKGNRNAQTGKHQGYGGVQHISEIVLVGKWTDKKIVNRPSGIFAQ